MSFLLLIVATSAFGQSSAELAADQLQRQHQRERAEADLLNKAQPNVRLSREAVPSPVSVFDTEPDVPCFPISSLSLTGNDVSRFAWVRTTADGLMNKCVGSPLGIQDLLAANVSHDLQNSGNGGGTHNLTSGRATTKS